MSLATDRQLLVAPGYLSATARDAGALESGAEGEENRIDD